ncbi:MAG TPA: tRNA 2-thiouridine(34) synthase MnmA [Phycisphaerae bacterium]|nr:tRNA 2-thiouridine(34) synthase MnmA [Phycisphaerae bacterium]
MSAKPRVLVAMSGGVDSSVAACLLCEQGYDVIGVFMRLGAVDEADGEVRGEAAEGGCSTIPLPIQSDRHRGCCSAADAGDARFVAGKLGFPFYALNFEEEFGRLKQYFADEYAAARTPNPCVRCNQWLKFGRLIDYAQTVKAEWIATGHYARVDQDNGRPRLRRARDLAKDQSYVLFGVAPETLRRTLFPLGELTKDEVRAIARRWDLPVHDKPESQDICFAPDRDYARVVRRYRDDAFVPGEIRHVDGRVLGRHDGLGNFTVGQRRGLRVAVGHPIYVTDLDAATATVTVGPQASVLAERASASQMSWLIERPAAAFRAEVRIRYNHEAAPGAVEPLPEDRVEVRFDEPQWAITPGQAMVIYRGDEVLGGGWID